MPGAREPVGEDALELVGSHPGVRRHHQLGQSLHTRRPQRFLIVFEHRLKRLRGAPFRVLRCERLDTVQGEGELDVERLLGPERPIVVEDGDARWRRHVVWPLLSGHRLDEREDAPLRLTIVPRRERIGLARVGLTHRNLPRFESLSDEQASDNDDRGR